MTLKKQPKKPTKKTKDNEAKILGDAIENLIGNKAFILVYYDKEEGVMNSLSNSTDITEIIGMLELAKADKIGKLS